MKLRVHPLAEVEIDEAFRWYGLRRDGLGLEFLAALDSAMERIARKPLRYARLETLPKIDTIRRLLLHRFPYTIIYEVLADIHVLAVAHAGREPNYWLDRR